MFIKTFILGAIRVLSESRKILKSGAYPGYVFT